jgi:hypothetical protein
MDEFVRTPSGQLAKHHFHEEVVVWVEGAKDLVLFGWVGSRYKCRLESAGGKPRCENLIEKLIEEDLPIVVIVDGDYTILQSKRSRHRRAVRLDRYSAENYLLEVASLYNLLCRVCPGEKEPEFKIDFGSLLENLQRELYDLVVLDIAAVRSNCGVPVLPRGPGGIFTKGESPEIQTEFVKAEVKRLDGRIPPEAVQSAQNLLRSWVRAKRFVDILCGHLVFAAIRRFLIQQWKARGKPGIVDNEVFRAVVADETWRRVWSDDHRRLRDRIRRAIRDAARLAA